MLWSHDDIQLAVRPEQAEEIGKLAVEAIGITAEKFKLRVETTGEYIIGNNWSECH